MARLRGTDLDRKLNHTLPNGPDRAERRRLIMCLWDVMERFGYKKTLEMAEEIIKERELHLAREFLLEGSNKVEPFGPLPSILLPLPVAEKETKKE